MQRQRSAVNSFSEVVDLNQEYASNNNGTDHPTWNEMLNAHYSRRASGQHLSESISSANTSNSGDPNNAMRSANNSRSVSGQDLGESSSSANNSNNNSRIHPTLTDMLNAHRSRRVNGRDFGESNSSANMRDHLSGTGLEVKHDLSSLDSASAPAEEEDRSEPSIVRLHGRVSDGLDVNQARWGPSNTQSVDPDQFPNMHYSRRNQYRGIDLNEGAQGIGAGMLPSFNKSSGVEVAHIPPASMPSGAVGSSSMAPVYFVEDDDEADYSDGTWGSSCKRKAVEGTSTQPYPVGNTSIIPQAVNAIPRVVPLRHNASSGLNTSSQAVNYVEVDRSDQPNSRVGTDMRGVASDVFPPSSASVTSDLSATAFGSRGSLAYQESLPVNLQLTGNITRRTTARSSHQSSRSINNSMGFGPTATLPSNSSNSSDQPPLMHGRGTNRSTPFTRAGSLNLRTTSSSSSLTLPGGRAAVLHDESGFGRSTTRNNTEHPMSFVAPVIRNVVHVPTNWSLGTPSSAGGVASSSRAGPSSSSRRVLLPHLQPQTTIPAQSLGPEAGNTSGNFSPFAPGPSSSSQPTAIPSGSSSQGPRQSFSIRSAFLEISGGDVNGRRSVAPDVTGRQSLVSEVCDLKNLFYGAYDVYTSWVQPHVYTYKNFYTYLFCFDLVHVIV